MEEELYDLEMEILRRLKGKFVNVFTEEKKSDIITNVAKSIAPDLDPQDLKKIKTDIGDMKPIQEMLNVESIEDIMVNNTNSIFVYASQEGQRKLDFKIGTTEELNMLIAKLKLYATNEEVKGNIMDVHLPNGSRANIVSSPLGYDVT